MNSFRRYGFTLIELSIVLVIMGLVIGGVLVGRDLIQAAQYRKVISEVENYTTAVYTFKSKYNCLPGDCPHAVAFWGATVPDPNDLVACVGDLVPGPYTDRTCNGSGNGRISHNWEHALAWQHLSLAALIPGLWSGVPGAAAYSAIPGSTVPMSAISPAGYMLVDWSEATAALHWIWYGAPAGNNISLGSQSGTHSANNTFLTAMEALQFDTKFDDSNITTGTIRGNGADPNNGLLAGTCDDPTVAGITCALIFIRNF